MAQRHFRARATLRHLVSIPAKVIIMANSPKALGCLIMDFSLGGAKIELDEDYPLPEAVMLFETHQQNIYECRVAWKKHRTVGLHFLDLCRSSTRKDLIEVCSLGLVDPGQLAPAQGAAGDAE